MAVNTFHIRQYCHKEVIFTGKSKKGQPISSFISINFNPSDIIARGQI